MSPVPKKVLFFVPHLGGGGAEMHVLRLLNSLDRSRFKPYLAVGRRGGGYESRLKADVDVVACAMPFIPSSLLRVFTIGPKLRRFLEQEKIELVIGFTNHGYAALANAVTSARQPRPILFAGIQNNLSRSLANLPKWTQAWLPRMIRRGYAQAEHTIALSRGVADALPGIVSATEGRISVIYNAGYDSAVEEMARREPDVAVPQGPLFVACGRLVPQKDFGTLLHAFARLEDIPGAHLWLLGDGKERDWLEREAKRIGVAPRVKFLGFQKNPFAYMARATALVLSSKWEGFGNVLTEAMVCKAPIISTDCPHGPREILEGGRWGELVPVGNVTKLAAAMRAAVVENDQFRHRAEQAYDHVRRYEAGVITRQYEEVFSRFLSADGLN